MKFSLALRGLTLLAGISCLLGGCANLGYYAQAVGGQMELLNSAQPVEDVLADPAISPAVKHALVSAREMRAFASSALHLPDNRSYTQYADLKRPYVLWNVFATEEFSTKPVQSCFIGAGCVAYRGFFSKEDAEAYGADLRKSGHDVFLGGVPAYSTLGWLNDPLINTFILYPPSELAQLIFHELAHQVVYVQDDSAFNESFATVVEQEGVQRWLLSQGNPVLHAAHAVAQERKSTFIGRMQQARHELDAVYASARSVTEKRAAKAAVFDALRRDLAKVSRQPERWLEAQLNNAQLASVVTYTEYVLAFRALLAREQGDFARFYAAVKEMGAMPKAERQAAMQQLLPTDEKKMVAQTLQ